MISTMLDHLPPPYFYGSLVGEGQTATKSYRRAEAALLRLHSENRSSHRANQSFKADRGSP